MKLPHLATLSIFLVCVLPSVRAQTFLIEASRVYTVAGKPLEPGKVVVRDGKVTEVGAEVSLDSSSPGVTHLVVDGSVAPGFIDCGSALGVLGPSADEFRELSPEIRVLDAVDFDQSVFERAFAAGVTAVAVSPGARNVVGGVGTVLRTGPPPSDHADRILKRDAFLDVSLGLEASRGNRNLRFSRPSSHFFRLPNTRMGTVFLVRRAFAEALDRLSPLDAEAPREFRTMLLPDGKKILRAALEGKLPLRLHADQHQELATALRLVEEFGAKIHIVGAAEAMPLVSQLAESGVSVVIHAGTNFREGRVEHHPEYTARLPQLLVRRGVPFAFFSGRGDDVELQRSRVALSLRFGLRAEEALEALTLGAARILGVDDRVGSIEPGQDADLVAFSGDPLDITARVLWVMSEGHPTANTLERKF